MRGKGLITVLAMGLMAAPAEADVQVSVGNFAFSPAEVTVFEGEIVNWNWVGPDTNHSVTSEATNEQRGSFDSDRNVALPNHPVGYRFSKEFEFAGEYRYFCKVHEGMAGRVIVRDRINDPSPPPPDALAPRVSRARVAVRKRRMIFRLSEPADVTARLRGRMRRTYDVQGKAGRNVIKLPRRMRRGRYRLILRATDDANNVSRRVVRRFRVPRR